MGGGTLGLLVGNLVSDLVVVSKFLPIMKRAQVVMYDLLEGKEQCLKL